MKLTEMKYKAFAQLASEIDNRIDRASNLYNTLLEEAGIPLRDEDKLHNGVTYLDALHNGIDIEWQTSWSYGGHASGDCYFPMEQLLDDTWEESITKRAEDTIKDYRKKIRGEKKRETKRDREQYDKLKKQFEGDV